MVKHVLVLPFLALAVYSSVRFLGQISDQIRGFEAIPPGIAYQHGAGCGHPLADIHRPGRLSNILEPDYQNPVLVVQVGKPSLLWTPFFATGQSSVHVGYASNGDTTFMGENPGTMDNKNGSALNMYGEYIVHDRSWGVISRPGYHQILADYPGPTDSRRVKDLYKTS